MGAEQGERDVLEHLAQWTWNADSNPADGVQRGCKQAHKAGLSFSFWLDQVLSLGLCYQKKYWPS